MSGPLYGVRLLVLTELDPDTGLPAQDVDPVWVTSPQQVGFEPQIIEGARQELRGGDRLIATVEEPDNFVGINATFNDATLNLEAMRLIGGGTVIDDEYIPPTVEEQAYKPPFKAEIYVAQYEEGAQEVSDVTGYAKVTLERCIGRVPGFTAQGQNFLVPSFTLKARDNKKANKPCFSVSFVDSLPTYPGV